MTPEEADLIDPQLPKSSAPRWVSPLKVRDGCLGRPRAYG
jgi:hypothetical protein